MSMKVRISTQGLKKRTAKLEKNVRSAFKNSINRTVTYGRRMISDELAAKTGLKRRRIFDAINISRASDQNLRGDITPLFPGMNGEKQVTRIWLSEFRFRSHKVDSIRRLTGQGPRYTKLLRTGFKAQFSFDSRSEIYMRERGKLRRARAAQVPTMFEIYDVADRWSPVLKDRLVGEVQSELARKSTESK